ncbi:hypothetical protein PC129_g13029 [Phytophthora cactorum]|uniref:MULE transposase domain-containing protein n=1 Tax=Phytophthora cactorum TaxID=29920 RepID=A0A329RRZ5_9STRA|nr:hypothetical protein Pcac1_g24765 [Phytophthora cactorum]KAG2813457.1 hypothetical protein PC112_g14733 [Phytophthora cactorum]KAG2818862.1 hypothetical protein PC111_g12134 [Phytophthora cactorum]KAG2852684.1 hypothetical protein PC113_g14814 [Phytophthora cactorum]KAG2895082.1 hypothetical protein PC114_g15632 [Phytophthora cactorum]
MSSTYNWRLTDILRGESRTNRKLDTLPPMGVIVSQLKHCTVCRSNLDQHHIRYRIYCYKSEPCLSALVPCQFKLKTLTCERSKQSHLYQHDQHFAASAPNQRPQLSLAMKAAIRELVEKDVKPSRIRNELVDSFTLSTGAVPALKQIQNFVYNYRRSTIMNTNVVEDMEEITAGSQLFDDLRDTTPFTFGYPLDEDGAPELGDGSDDDPLVIGITTQFLLKAAARDPDVFVFHMDATFMLVTCAHQVIVCGISDAARQFHPMAFFITSQRTTVQYSHALRTLMDIYKVVVGRPFLVRYCMGDAEDAQINGVEQTLAAPSASVPSKPEVHYLMCFFHVVET